MRSTALRIPFEAEAPAESAYTLAEQINHRLRRAHQRASAIFLDTVGDLPLTPTQWSAMATLSAEGALSQNQLGRLTCMDPATTQGVILRLVDRGLVERHPDPHDRRRTSVRLTAAGQTMVASLLPKAQEAHARTLAPLSPDEQATFMSLLGRLL